MSGFLRPEALAVLKRRRETVAGLAVLAFGGWVLVSGLMRSSVVLITIGAVVVLLTGAVWIAWRQRQAFRRDIDAPGMVQVTEAQIGYLGPETGQFVDRDALTRVELVSGGGGAARWVLYQRGAEPVSIPLSVQGADQLVDLFAGLPGVDIAAALSALDRRRASVVQVWPRQG